MRLRGFFGGFDQGSKDECWIWQRHIDKRGYGRTHFNGANGALAHRVAYELLVGPIPDGMTIDHLCFVTACVNPNHLQVQTHEVNTERQRSAVATHCKNGHEFTPENTYQRPERYRTGKRQCRACNRDAVRRYQMRKRAA